MPRFDRIPALAVGRALAIGVCVIRVLAGGAACAPERASVPPARPAVRNAWARPAAAGADGALYFTLANPGRDTLVIIGARAEIAATTSMHETMQMGEGTGIMAHMTPITRLAIAPGDSTVLAPLGRHAMLERLRRPLAVGDSVPFALTVIRGSRSDTVRATAVVRPF